MNFEELLKDKPCTCGMTHTCSIKHILVEEGANQKLSGLLGGYRKILLVADTNTYAACGESIKAQIGERLESLLIYQRDGLLIPNEEAVDEMFAKLTDQTDLIVGIGSGVIQDTCKYVSFQKKLPYYIVATAPSMDGYASVGAAMIMGGMKVTYSAHVPEAIIADVDVLKNAPMDMIKAGYGDILGKYSCLNDWKLAKIVRNEYFCDYVYDLTYDMLVKTKDLGPKLLLRDPDAVRTLMEAIVGVGVAMAFVGNSRPASGSEHHLSHFFEITGILNDEPYFMHGTDVVYSSVYTERLREELLQLDVPPKNRIPGRPEWEQKIREIYTTIADSVIALQDKMGWYEEDWYAVYAQKWPEIKAVLAEAPSSEEMIAYLKSIEMDIDEFEALYGKDKIDAALKFGKDLKDRYSVLWLYYSLMVPKGKNGIMAKDTIKVIAMDLDGTLTQHKQHMTERCRQTLTELGKRYKLLMVGAGQVYRIFNQLEQFPIDIIGNYGLQYATYNPETKDLDIVRDLSFPYNKDDVEQRVRALREKHGYTDFVGDNVEYHPSGCLTFPVLGTKAAQSDKLAFDPDRKKRRAFYRDVVEAFPDYTVFVGGSSSFDMAPMPYNKFHALDQYCAEHGLAHENVLYVGDDYGLGGNDESVYQSDIPFLCVDDYAQFPDLISCLLGES